MCVYGEDGKVSDQDSVASIKDSVSLSDLMVDDMDEEEEEEEEDDPPPLFIYLTCSVRTDTSMLKSMPVRHLPTCLSKYILVGGWDYDYIVL